MATVAWVLRALAHIDSETPVGLIKVKRGGEIHSISLDVIDDVHVEVDPESGRPLGVWLVAEGSGVDVPDKAVPRRWPLRRVGCGCVIPVDVRPEERVTTLAVRCPHYEPTEMALALADSGRVQR